MRHRRAAVALAFTALCFLGALLTAWRVHRAPDATKEPPRPAPTAPSGAGKKAPDAGKKGGAGVLVFDGENWWVEEKKNGRVIRKRLVESPAAGNK